MANQGVEVLSTVLATYQNGGNVTQTVYRPRLSGHGFATQAAFFIA
jgi:hypothetical protein